MHANKKKAKEPKEETTNPVLSLLTQPVLACTSVNKEHVFQ